MKRLIGALAIALFFLGVNFYAGSCVSEVCGEMTIALELCAEKIKGEDYEGAEDIMRALEEKWESSKILLNVVSGESTHLSPGRDIGAIHDSIRDKNYADSLLLIRECQGRLKEAVEAQRLNLDNIL